MRIKVLITFLYLIFVGVVIYWYMLPTLVLVGDTLPEILGSFIRFNIPQFFLIVFLLSLPVIWILIPKFEDSPEE